MRMQFQFSEQTLYAAGFDRPTVEAFRHLLKQVGKLNDGMTLPEVVTEIEDLAITPVIQAPMQPEDVFLPAYVEQPTDGDFPRLAQAVEQIEFLQTEVRQLAEQVALLTSQINDLKQGTTL